MARPIVRVCRDSMGWAVDAEGARHDRHMLKEEAVLRARQLVWGEAKAHIVIQDDKGDVERDIYIGRPSFAP